MFESELAEPDVKAALEGQLSAFAGKPVVVVVRTSGEMARVFAQNPFPNATPNRTVAIFLDEPPAPDALENVAGQQAEEVQLGEREIYVHYGAGMARSRLHIPAAGGGTARSMHTLA